MASERDLPKIKQILFAADGIGDTPMSDEESQEWFNNVVERNRRERIRREASDANSK